MDLGDGAQLRRATHADLDDIIAIKRALPMPRPRSGRTNAGGFLLGCDVDTYAQLLELANVWLLSQDGHALGFCVTLDDAVLRGSPVWGRRQQIVWSPEFDADVALRGRVAYFDQLAVLPRGRSRYLGAALALRALAELIDELGHEFVLTTTVLEPVLNRAALPHLLLIGAREVGRIREHYDEVGAIVSAIHMIEAGCYREHATRLPVKGRPALRRVVELIQDDHGR